jgi:hypothetical protein
VDDGQRQSSPPDRVETGKLIAHLTSSVSLQKNCQICKECQHAKVVYGPFENRQPSVRTKPAPILKAIPGMTGTTRKRKPFEPTHLELPPIGSIYVPLDEDCQTHGNIPYVVRPERPIIDNGLLLIVPAPLHGRAGPLVEQAHLA